MNGSAYLWLYFLVVLGVIVLPGLDMAFVLVSALVGGRSGRTGSGDGRRCRRHLPCRDGRAGVYGGVALLAQRASRWFDANPRTNAVAGRVVGAVLVCAGIFTAVNGWQAA